MENLTETILLTSNREVEADDILMDEKGILRFAISPLIFICEPKDASIKPQDIYFLTQDLIRSGDYVFDTNLPEAPIFRAASSISKIEANLYGYNKVSATTNPLIAKDGVPKISLDYVKNYVKSHNSELENSLKLNELEIKNEKMRSFATNLIMAMIVAILILALTSFTDRYDEYVLDKVKRYSIQNNYEVKDYVSRIIGNEKNSYALWQVIPQFNNDMEQYSVIIQTGNIKFLRVIQIVFDVNLKNNNISVNRIRIDNNTFHNYDYNYLMEEILFERQTEKLELKRK